MFWAHIHRSTPSINCDLQSKIAQITTKDMFNSGRYNDLYQRDFQDCDSDIAEQIWMLRNSSWETVKSYLIVKKKPGS